MSATGKRTRVPGRGFTLIEMLVVLAIVALVSALAFPAVDRTLDARRAVAAGEAVGRALKAARAEALRGGAAVTLDVNSLRTRSDEAAPLPADAAIALTPQRIAFHADGSAIGGTARVETGGRSFGWRIEGETGLVRRIAEPQR